MFLKYECDLIIFTLLSNSDVSYLFGKIIEIDKFLKFNPWIPI